MRVADCTADHYENHDANLRRTVRAVCSLPKRACVYYMAASRAEGGLGYSILTILELSASSHKHAGRFSDENRL